MIEIGELKDTCRHKGLLLPMGTAHGPGYKDGQATESSVNIFLKET